VAWPVLGVSLTVVFPLFVRTETVRPILRWFALFDFANGDGQDSKDRDTRSARSATTEFFVAVSVRWRSASRFYSRPIARLVEQGARNRDAGPNSGVLYGTDAEKWPDASRVHWHDVSVVPGLFRPLARAGESVPVGPCTCPRAPACGLERHSGVAADGGRFSRHREGAGVSLCSRHYAVTECPPPAETVSGTSNVPMMRPSAVGLTHSCTRSFPHATRTRRPSLRTRLFRVQGLSARWLLGLRIDCEGRGGVRLSA